MINQTVKQDATPGSPKHLTAYDFVIAVICVFSLGLVMLRYGFAITPEAGDTITFFDNMICVIFFVDFLYTLKREEKKLRYFYTWGWVDLLSCIPDVGIFRIGRIGRIFRVLRIIRIIKSVQVLFFLLFTRSIENTFICVGAFAFLALAGGSCGILVAEQSAPDANITNAGDAIWWAFTTITTIGHGDLYPVTFHGRVVAAILALTGIGLVSAFTASAAAILSKKETVNG